MRIIVSFVLTLALTFVFLFNAAAADLSGEAYFKQGKYDLAIKAIQKEIEAKKITKNTYNLLGLSYVSIKDYTKAEEAFKKGLTLPVSDSGLIQFNLGNLYYTLGNYKNAIESYTLALEGKATYAPAALNRANATLMAGNLSDALTLYKDYQTQNPANPQKAKIEELIKRLEAHLAGGGESSGENGDTPSLSGLPNQGGDVPGSSTTDGGSNLGTAGGASGEGAGEVPGNSATGSTSNGGKSGSANSPAGSGPSDAEFATKKELLEQANAIKKILEDMANSLQRNNTPRALERESPLPYKMETSELDD